MNKKLIAIAVAGALATPAAALAQTVYGRLNAEWGLSVGQMDHPTAGSRDSADGFNSGALGGSKSSVTLGGTRNLDDVCQPA